MNLAGACLILWVQEGVFVCRVNARSHVSLLDADADPLAAYEEATSAPDAENQVIKGITKFMYVGK